jgi:hypothetical protein
MIAVFENIKKRDEERARPLREYLDKLKISYQTSSAFIIYATLNAEQIYEMAEKSNDLGIAQIRNPDEDPKIVLLEGKK